MSTIDVVVGLLRPICSQPRASFSPAGSDAACGTIASETPPLLGGVHKPRALLYGAARSGLVLRHTPLPCSCGGRGDDGVDRTEGREGLALREKGHRPPHRSQGGHRGHGKPLRRQRPAPPARTGARAVAAQPSHRWGWTHPTRRGRVGPPGVTWGKRLGKRRLGKGTRDDTPIEA